MPYVGFEPTIPASEQVKRIHVLDGSATGITFWFAENLKSRDNLWSAKLW
jgi:hypothetical protein